MHNNSLEIFKKYGLEYYNPNMDVFEIGPDRQLYSKKCIDDRIGLNNYNFYYSDISKEQLSKIASNHWNMASTTLDSVDMTHYIKMTDDNKFECDDNKFDVVYAANVIEHVRMPWLWLKEIVRVTKQNGIIILICPGITQNYHKDPIDCWRIWPDGFKALFDYVEIKTIMSATEHLITEPSGYQHIDTIAIGTKI